MSRKIIIAAVLAVLLIVPLAYSQGSLVLQLSMTPSTDQTESGDITISGSLADGAAPIRRNFIEVKLNGALMTDHMAGLTALNHTDSSFSGTRDNITGSGSVAIAQEASAISY